MNKEREALTLALERMDRARNILTNGSPTPACNWGMLDTSDLRKALAQPEQEPPKHWTPDALNRAGFVMRQPERPWVGLTDEEFNSIFDQYKGTRYIGALIECVVAKLKEKNT